MKDFISYIESDDAIFHYTKLEIGLEKILPTRKFRLSSMNQTNDPQEYKNWNFSLSYTGEEIDVKEKWEYAHYELNNIIKKKSFIGCFCTNRKNICEDQFNYKSDKINFYGYKRSRMWAQYGDRHKGMCFVFSKTSVEEHLRKLFSTNVKCLNVQYFCNDSIYRASVINGNNLNDYPINEAIDKHLSQHYDQIFFSKNIDYRDESEYRIVIIDRDELTDYKVFDYDESLKGVIIGDKFPDVYLPSLLEYKDNLELIKLTWLDGKYYPIKIQQSA